MLLREPEPVVLRMDRLLLERRLLEPVVLRKDRLLPEVEALRTGCRLPAQERPEQRRPGREREGKHCLRAREREGKHCLRARDPPRMRHHLQARGHRARPFPAKGRRALEGLPEALG